MRTPERRGLCHPSRSDGRGRRLSDHRADRRTDTAASTSEASQARRIPRIPDALDRPRVGPPIREEPRRWRERILLRTQRADHWAHTTLNYQWEVAKKRAGITKRLTPYSLRHFFASNCLSNGIPITDVAEWMGHRNINMTFKIYRHLMPASVGRTARLLNEGP
ncbi:tyrosine-type recombinase/integrase [Streptomyces sp. NBC_00989]|uniref:tyrosine-type recombinase/integrase n=1 Tax=Streptomyces sp. NBC_00989 TaxID=2903705 RepID=UPI00386AA278|nr:tyrosine-type recombinase/integrase [Streptomyces sp. NBC_00989]